MDDRPFDRILPLIPQIFKYHIQRVLFTLFCDQIFDNFSVVAFALGKFKIAIL